MRRSTRMRAGALDGYELNVSCPNAKAGGHGVRRRLRSARGGCAARARGTKRPLFVKLSPTLPDIARSASVAADAGADAITLVNTIPGLVIDVEQRKPALGFGTGGVSGTALRPVGVLATWKVHRAVKLPLLGIGGVVTAEDALQYLIAGASLVGMGTAMLRDPRAPERVVRGAREVVRASRRRAVSRTSSERWSIRYDSCPTRTDCRARCPDRLPRRSRSPGHLGDACRFFKVGNELFTAAGPGDRPGAARGARRRRLSRPQVPRHPEHGCGRGAERGGARCAAPDGACQRRARDAARPRRTRRAASAASSG